LRRENATGIRALRMSEPNPASAGVGFLGKLLYRLEKNML